MELVEHAKRELKLAGMYDKDADYDGELAPTIVEIVEIFAKQDYSGASAGITIDILERLLRFKTLAPITSDPEEWMDVTEMSSKPMWQNTRDSRYFSKDAGNSWYNVDDK